MVAAAILIAVAAAGCGLGPGESSQGTASITVTRDYGAEKLTSASVNDPPASETVMRALDSSAEITTRYGGRFVQSINGIESSNEDGRVSDWFFFVNGIESSTGAADVHVRAGDRVWWDYRDWTNALRTPAVVGSWPEPFLQAASGSARLPVDVVCLGARSPCDAAAEHLTDAGVDPRVTRTAGDAPHEVRMLVGTWDRVRKNDLAQSIEDGPGGSGVFAKFVSLHDGWRLIALNDQGEGRLDYDTDAGLVAAMRQGDDPPTWVVTGVDPAGVKRAVQALSSEALANRYAVVNSGGTVTPLPVR